MTGIHMHISAGRPAEIKSCQSAQDSSANHAQETCMHTSEERPSQIKARQSAKESRDREHVCTLVKKDLLESRPASLQRTAANLEQGIHVHNSRGRPPGLKACKSAKDSSAGPCSGQIQMQTSKGRPTGIKACKSAQDSSAKHRHSSRD